MERRPGYYVVRLSVVALMFVGGWAAFFLIGSSWWQLATAGFLAVAFAQLGLVAHDLAHRQVFRTKRPSEVAGLLAGNLGIGMSYGWWMDKHTRHHNNPNHDDLDPDVAPGGTHLGHEVGSGPARAEGLHHPPPGGPVLPAAHPPRRRPEGVQRQGAA